MPHYPQPIEQLLQSFMALPGIGRKTAERFVFFLLKQPQDTIKLFSDRLLAALVEIKLCKDCKVISLHERCTICSDPKRNHQAICVVAESPNVFTLEQTAAWDGVYHVLGGVINHFESIGPEHLQIQSLIERIKRDQVNEVIIATNPDNHGETTALYLIDAIKPLNIKTSRLARGLPAGADIEFADDVTLGNALKDRRII
jgi:recombination protein RecR